MQTKKDIVNHLLYNKPHMPVQPSATAFASSNIALCKYWGKRNHELNLPITNSVSISLGQYGTQMTVQQADTNHDVLTINQQQIPDDQTAYQRLHQFLNLFRPHKDFYYAVDSQSTIPIAAGLASSASAFASIVQALDRLHQWQCSQTELSILARLGSGSACRSLWAGFVEWHKGTLANGMDSHGVPLDDHWDALRIALLVFDQHPKKLSSREAMQRTVETSPLYAAWSTCVSQHLAEIKSAIQAKDIVQLGQAVEQNALAMHATMLSSHPSIVYTQPATLAAMQRVWALREEKQPIYFTQDAGPNLKLLFTAEMTHCVKQAFPDAIIV